MKRIVHLFNCPLTYLAVLGFLGASPAHADYAVMRSGARIHITSYERKGDMVRLSLGGGITDVAAADIVSIEPEDVFLAGSAPAQPRGPYGQIIQQAAQKSGVDQELISSVISAESGFNSRAVSPKNAQGLMQLIPSTASRYAVSDAFDPSQNIDGGTRYLRDLLTAYHGDTSLALAAYNAGPQRVEQYNGVPPYRETQAYVKRVTTKYQQAKKKSAASRQPVCYPELVACPDIPAIPLAASSGN
jgi:soluble lytic murein transglycosylase-like protein